MWRVQPWLLLSPLVSDTEMGQRCPASAPSDSSACIKPGEERSLPEVSKVRSQALEILQLLTIMGDLAFSLPHFIYQQQNTSVLFHFSDLTPVESLPFTRAFIPQAPLTLMASAPVPHQSLHQLCPAMPLQGLFLWPIHGFCFFVFPSQNSPQIPSGFGLQFLITPCGQLSSRQYQTPKISCAWFPCLSLLSWLAFSGELLQLAVTENETHVWYVICVIPPSPSYAKQVLGTFNLQLLTADVWKQVCPKAQWLWRSSFSMGT